MLPNVKMLLLIALTKQKLNAKWITNRNASIVSRKKVPSNELQLLRRYSISRIFLVILEFNNVSCNRESKMRNWRKGEKKKRLLDHTILCLMWRKTRVYQERRSESWKRISCRYEVRRKPICKLKSVMASGNSTLGSLLLAREIVGRAGDTDTKISFLQRVHPGNENWFSNA